MHRALAVVAAIVLTLSVDAATLQNDDSCDISLAPAATLLLPYFEIDLESNDGVRTFLSITNTSPDEQIARVTLWTDYAYPVLTFNVGLTGHDLQNINLHEIIKRGVIDVGDCGGATPPLDAVALARMQQALTTGDLAACKVGDTHANAIGYATIDVVGNCSTHNPTEAAYFTTDLRFANVLIGDYVEVQGNQNYARGNPLVHIRAIPEGAIPATRAVLPRYKTNLPRTFYGRFQHPDRPAADARQPLPSTFALRWINGGLGSFATSLKVWRDGVTPAAAPCIAYQQNAAIAVTESVGFDQHENGAGMGDPCDGNPCIDPDPYPFPSTSRVSIENVDVFPHYIFSATIAGWVYLNLDDGNLDNGAHQNWVIASMAAEHRYSVDFDASWLGNGCSPPAAETAFATNTVNNPEPQRPGAILPGPAPDVIP